MQRKYTKVQIIQHCCTSNATSQNTLQIVQVTEILLTSKIPRKEESLIFSSIQLPGLLRSEIGRSGIKNNVANSIMTNSTSNPNKAGNF